MAMIRVPPRTGAAVALAAAEAAAEAAALGAAEAPDGVDGAHAVATIVSAAAMTPAPRNVLQLISTDLPRSPLGREAAILCSRSVIVDVIRSEERPSGGAVY